MRPAGTYLGTNAYNKHQEIRLAQELIDKVLGDDFKHRVTIIKLEEHKLELATETPALAHRLQYFETQIVAALKNARWPKMQRLRARVQPLPKPRKKAKTTMPISKDTQSHIQKLADATDDPKLKKAFAHLARVARDSNQA